MAHLPENAYAVPENVIADPELGSPERLLPGQERECPGAPLPKIRTRIQGFGIIPPFVLPADDNLPVVVGSPEQDLSPGSPQPFLIPWGSLNDDSVNE